MPLPSWATIENLPGILYVYDRQGHFLKWNKNFERVCGYSGDEIRHMTALDFIDPRQRELVASRIADVFSRGTSSVEANFMSKDGTAKPFYLTGDRIQIDGEACVFGMGIDISERVRIAETLAASEERFRLLARATNDAIWDWNLATNETWRSEGFQKLFGQNAEANPSIDDWSTHIHPEDRERVTTGISRALDGASESWSDEYRYLRHDGSVAHVLDRGYIIRGAGGAPTRMIGGMTDVTERKKLEAQFLRAQRLESIGTLAGGIAHDLNNILSPVLLSVGLLKADETDPQRMHLLETIDVSGRRGADMVRQVLAFARGVEAKRVEVNLRHLLRDVQKMMRETIQKNIDVVFTVPADLWTVNADVTQLNQVLMNLCVNARDAMPDGGSLRVEAANVRLDEVYTGMLGELSPGPYVVITTSDTGMGMSREVQNRIFEPFFTTKELGKGTGLGLSTVLTIVKAHGGAIDVHSQPGAGTTFKVSLPALSRAAAVVAASDEPLPAGGGELILVVDDEDHVLSLTQKTLERHGYQVLIARNGAQAVALYAEHRDVAAVLTDMAMPVMDGFATIAALKAINPALVVLASSGHAAQDAHAKAFSAGATAFIDKPYTVEVLVRAIHDVLHRRRGPEPESSL
jgi:PAS domain S-box-containing protein